MSKGKRSTGNGVVVRVTGSIPLPYGWASIVLASGRIVSIEWEKKKDSVGKSVGEKFPDAEEIGAENTLPGKILSAYSRGRILTPREISTLPISWEAVSEFRRKVLRAAAEIPYGKTVTYGELAVEVGHPGAARAVGAALSRNPWPILIPCHRVVGKGGRLVGFGKGLDAKEALLRFEERNLLRGGVAQ